MAAEYSFSGRKFQKGTTSSSVPSNRNGLVNVDERGEWIVYQKGHWEMGNFGEAHWAIEGPPGDAPPSGSWTCISREGRGKQPNRDGERLGQEAAAEKAAHDELNCMAFAISFRVRFDNFDNNYPMCVTTEHNALQCHGLGPAYGDDRGRICVYLATQSGKGPHGRGILGTEGRSKGEGWVRSVPLRVGQWHSVRVVKTRRTLSIAIDGQVVEATVPEALRDDDFDMKAPGRTLVASGKGHHALHGNWQTL